MASPDVSGYVDLTVYDVDPAELVTQALLVATTAFPDWDPRDGNTEVVLLEAFALEVAEAVYAINRVPGAVVDVLLRLYGVTRGLGVAPTATVDFTVAAAVGFDLPAGTVLRLPLGIDDSLDFTVDETVTVASGATTATAAVTATRATADANGTATGTDIQVVTSVPYVDSAVLASPVTAGSDPETDEAWRDRGIQRLARLVTTLVLPEHFEAEALATEGVHRAKALDNFDPAVGPNVGDNAGHVTVAVIGTGGALLSGGAKTALHDALDAQAQANLAVHVVDPTVTAVNIAVTVHPKTGYTSGEVTTNVTAALNAYLSPDAWGWGDTVYRNELISIIDQAEGVDRVVTLTTPGSDVGLTGAANLADLGTITVAVS